LKRGEGDKKTSNYDKVVYSSKVQKAEDETL